VAIGFTRRTVGAAPLLLARRHDVASPAPLVLWLHGFRAESEVHRPELARVAEAGFLVAAVDAVGHGHRHDPALDAEVARRGALPVMLEQVRVTAWELPAIVDALVADGLADASRVSAVGISMGGYLAYHAVTTTPRIRTVIALLGSPEWPDGDGPARHLDAFRDVALLSITAEHDASVPPDAARRFHAALVAAYPDARAAYHELRGAVHLMSAEHWEQAMAATHAWLGRYGTRTGGVAESPAER